MTRREAKSLCELQRVMEAAGNRDNIAITYVHAYVSDVTTGFGIRNISTI